MLPFLWCVGLATALLSLVTPRQIGRLTDLFVINGAAVTWRDVNTALLLILGAQLLISMLAFCDRSVVTELREKVLRNVERYLFSRVLRLSPEFFRTRTADNVTTRCLDDAWHGVEFQCRGLVSVPLAIASVATYGGYMMYNNWFLASVTLLLSLLGGYFLLFDRPLQQVNRAARQSWDDLRDAADETISGVEALRDNFAFDYGLGRVEEPIVRQSREQTVRGRWMAAFDAIGPLTNMIQLIAVYWIGAALCMSESFFTPIAGQLTWGQVIQFSLISTLFQKPVGELLSFLKKWRLVRENTRRVGELLECEETFRDGTGLPLSGESHDIEFQEVTVATEDGKRIINRVSVDIGYGQRAAIAGTAGSGKSTLLALLTSGANPEEGTVRIGGTSIDQLDRRALAGLVGKVPQFPKIFSGTIRDNLLLSLRRPGSRTLHYDGSHLCLDSLEGIDSPEELERRLLDIIQLVDLDRDIFRKALDQYLGTSDRYASIRESIVKLRHQVRAAVDTLGPDLVGWFEDNSYLPFCSLCENLIGPGWQRKDLTDEQYDALLGRLSESKQLLPLLQLGYGRLRSEEELAARLSKRAPRLMKLVSSATDGDKERTVLRSVRGRDLSEWSPSEQKSLLEIALDTQAGLLENVPTRDPETFVLELRNQLKSLFPAEAWLLHEQSVFADRLNVRDNLLGGRTNSGIHRADTAVETAIHQVLAENDFLYPVMLLGLDVKVARDGQDLSGGQRQKLALGRAVLKNPGVLLLDEATASLDELSENKIMEMLEQQCRHKTVVAISHRLGSIHGFDKVVVMDGGQKVQEGSFHELAQQAGLFQDLLRGSPLNGRQTGTGADSSAGKAQQRASTTRSDSLDYLRVCPLFANLDSDRLIAIQALSNLVSCRKGDAIFERGDIGDELFVVCEGTVEFFATPKSGSDNVEDVVDTCGPGQVFGELALFGDMRRTLGARAREPVKLIRLGRDEVFRLMDADPSIGLSFLRILARRIGDMRSEMYSDDEVEAKEAEGRF